MNTLRKKFVGRVAAVLLLVVLLIAALAALPGSNGVVAQGERLEKPAPGEATKALEVGESATNLPSWVNDEDEPNDDMATAEDNGKCGQGYYFNCVLGGTIGGNGDVDYWAFQLSDSTYSDHFAVLIDIEATSIGSSLDPAICLYADDGTELSCNDDTDTLDSMLFYNFEAHRTYYLRIEDFYGIGGSDYKYQIIATTPLLISAQTRGKVDGIAFEPGDVLAWSSDNGSFWEFDYDPTWEKWVMFLDASDLGINANLNSLAAGWRNSDYLLVGFQTNVGLPGITGKVTPWDVVVFDPTIIGPATQGTFQSWWAGKDYGLALRNEKIDAIDWPNWTGDTRLYVSTVGPASVPSGWQNPGVLQDEDVGVAYTSFSTWDRFFDGNRVEGLGIEDVVAMDVADYSDDSYNYMLLVIQGSGRVGDNGLRVTQKDIFMTVTNPTPYTSLHDWFWTTYLFWHGPDHGWNYNIDAIEYPRLDKDCLSC